MLPGGCCWYCSGGCWYCSAGWELLPPPIIPVIALPATWPTALPIATPPAVAAICFIRLGCWGWAIADGGAAIGVEGGGGGGAALGAGAGGARAMGALGGGEAARPRRGIFTLSGLKSLL